MEVRDLNPFLIWSFFDEITQTPRPSKKEKKIVQYLLNFAHKYGLEAQKDNASNILICKPATPGKEKAATVILQSHMDMVCEKNEKTVFDFENDAIQTYIEDGWVKAKGTTLGADDGIGMAAALAILASNDIEHGPIRALFTTDEETGLTGANNIDPKFLEGDILLNLDSEEWGEFCIGCAGGKTTIGTFSYTPESASNRYFWLEVQVSGLNGGHSGSNIHQGLGNANKILTRYLWSLKQECQLVIAQIDGGNLHNAIPREAKATFGIPSSFKEKARILLNILQSELEIELAHTDKNVSLSLHSTSEPTNCVDLETSSRLINALYSLPHGVIGWSHDMPDIVETSTNLASIKMIENHKIEVTTSQRSSVESLKTDICNQVSAVFELAKAEIHFTDGYPGWKPNPTSPILQIAQKTFEDLFQTKAIITSIHAGLECGLFFTKNSHLDMISFGPTILGAHSPEERMEIETVEKWWNLLVELLKRI